LSIKQYPPLPVECHIKEYCLSVFPRDRNMIAGSLYGKYSVEVKIIKLVVGLYSFDKTMHH
jgi:hypothetical protein